MGGPKPHQHMLSTETVNDPDLVATLPCMLSVNAAMQVDQFAQANASFVDGHGKTDSSTVVPVLTNPATSFQDSAVVREHGCADLFGRSQHAQAQLLKEQVADPRARDELSEAAHGLGLRRDFD